MTLFKTLLIAIALVAAIKTDGKSQDCKGIYTLSYTSSKTKQNKKIQAKVSFLTGWQLWQLSGEATYKSSSNLSFIFALVYLPDKQVLLRLFKGTGSSVYGTQYSPYVNCDEIILYNSIDGTDIQGTKSTLTKASF